MFLIQKLFVFPVTKSWKIYFDINLLFLLMLFIKLDGIRSLLLLIISVLFSFVEVFSVLHIVNVISNHNVPVSSTLATASFIDASGCFVWSAMW